MWNFDYLDTLTLTPLRHARIYSTTRPRNVSLLFVHGGFHGAWCWATFLKFFADNDVACSAVDLRGHGGQKQDSDFLQQGAAAMADDVTEAARAIGGDIVLIGHSAGALAAMLAARSIKPRAIALIAPAAPANSTVKTAVPAFAGDHGIAIPPEERFRKWFLQGTDKAADITPVMSRLCLESPAFMNDCFAHGVTINPASITCPTLCVSGARDVSPLHARGQDQVVAKFLNAEIEVIPDVGHSLMIEPLWRTGAVAILGWLRRNGVVAV